MGNMKFWWIFGFEWWGSLRPAEMKTARGDCYIPLFLGIWLRRPTRRATDGWHIPPPVIGNPDDVIGDPVAKVNDSASRR